MPRKQTPTAHDLLRKALLDAGAITLTSIKVTTQSTLELYSLRGGHMRIVQHFTDTGGWDAYKPIKASKTDEAIAEVLSVDDHRAELIEALELMLKAWEQLLPLLKNGSVQDYELVCTTAPVKARSILARVKN